MCKRTLSFILVLCLVFSLASPMAMAEETVITEQTAEETAENSAGEPEEETGEETAGESGEETAEESAEEPDGETAGDPEGESEEETAEEPAEESEEETGEESAEESEEETGETAAEENSEETPILLSTQQNAESEGNETGEETTPSNSCGESLTWSMNTETGTLTISGSGGMSNYSEESPAPWDNYKSQIKEVVFENSTVESVGSYAFAGCASLKRVIFPLNLTAVGNYAFQGCTSLSFVWICDNSQVTTTIGDYAFAGTALTEIYIPGNVTTVGANAFDGCTSLKEAALENGVETVGAYAFKDCTALVTVDLPNSVTIAENAFTGCTPKNLYCKGKAAPANAPTATKSYCSAYYFPCGKQDDDEYSNVFWHYDNDGNVLISGTGETGIYDEKCFLSYVEMEDLVQIKTLTIDEGVTAINQGMLSYYSCYQCYESEWFDALTSVSIPVSMEKIYLIENLITLNVNYAGTKEQWNKIHAVGVDDATISEVFPFATITCSDGTIVPSEDDLTIELKPCKTDDNYYIFSNDKYTQTKYTLTIKTTSKSVELDIPWRALTDYFAIRDIVIEDGVTSIGAGSFTGMILDSIQLPVSLTSISEGAFDCENITKLTFAGTKEQWKSVAGYQYLRTVDVVCTDGTIEASLAGDTFGENSDFSWSLSKNYVLTITGTGVMPDLGDNGADAPWIDYKENITGVVIKEGVTSVADCAFLEYKSLTSVEFPEGLTDVGEYAFCCTGLAGTVTLPASLQTLDFEAFAGCGNLTAFSVAEGNLYFAATDGVLFDKDNKTLLIYPAGKSDESYDIPEGVESVDVEAFMCAWDLESVTFPESVKTIEEGAFTCCGLTSVAIGSGVTYIGPDAFAGCEDLVEVTIPQSVEWIGECAFCGRCYVDTETYVGVQTVYYGDSHIEDFRELAALCHLYDEEDESEDVSWVMRLMYAFFDTPWYYSLVWANGLCGAEEAGENLTWKIEIVDTDEEYSATLVITGHGAMKDYNCAWDDEGNLTADSVPAPWADLKAGFTAIRFQSDDTGNITHIGNYAFQGMSDITEVTIPESVTSIGAYAFSDCTNRVDLDNEDNIFIGLETVTILADENLTIGESAFDKCEMLKSVVDGDGKAIDSKVLARMCAGTSCNVYDRLNGVFKDSELIESVGTSAYIHSMVTIDAKAATCLETGNAVYYHCSACDKYFTDIDGTTETTIDKETIAALGHDMGTVSYVWSNDLSTCTATRTCTRNGCGYTETAKATITSAETTPATCTTAGVKTYTAVFNASWAKTQTETEAIKALGHTVVTDEAVAATCTEAGKTEGSHCSVCKEVLEAQETVPALGHDMGTVSYVWSNDLSTCTATRTCTRNGCSYTETAKATITSAETTPATCTTAGVKTYTAVFNESWAKTQTETEAIKALGHTVVTDEAVAATCTEEGKTSGAHCSVCQAVLVAQETVPAAGHDWGTAQYEWSKDFSSCTATRYCDCVGCTASESVEAVITSEVKVAATCTTAGEMIYTATFKNTDWAETQTMTGTIQAAGHTVVTDEAIEATCTEAGKTEGSHCSVCKEVLVAQETVPALGHDWGTVSYTWSEDLSTCTATRTCTRDGCQYGQSAKATIKSVVTKAATCTTTGILTFTAKFTVSWANAQTAQGITNALGHSIEKVEAKSATCTEAGNIEFYTCTRCDEVYADAEGTQVLALNDVILPAKGHTMELVEAKEATTTTVGNHPYYVCSECHQAFKDEQGTTATTAEAEVIARIMEIKVDDEKKGNADVDTASVTSALEDVTNEIGLAEATTESVKEALAESVSAENLEEISEAVAAALESGKEVSVSMNVEQVQEESLSTEQKELLSQMIPEESENTTSVVAAYLDLTVELKAEEETLGRVTQLSKTIKFSVELSEEEVAALNNRNEKTNTNIYVARIHEGEVELIPATLDGNILTFETDQFSLFTVVTVTYTRGDVNDDGVFDIQDVLRLIRYITGATDTVNAAAADASGDNQTDLLDLVRMMRKLCGEEIELN